MEFVCLSGDRERHSERYRDGKGREKGKRGRKGRENGERGRKKERGSREVVERKREREK